MIESPRELLVSGAAELGVHLSGHQLDQFDVLTSVLLKWNQELNLTRVTDPAEIAIKHYLDSISLLAFVKVADRALVIDVGTGAGIPGIPLKIAVPGIRLTLLDSVRKKLAFAEAAASELGLDGVKFAHARAEDAGRNHLFREKYDFSVSRAVARLNLLAEYCLPLCRVGGCFVAYKGPDMDEEIAEASSAFQVLGGKLEQTYKFALPHTDISRTLVVVGKKKHTPADYPRKAGVPEKKPILWKKLT